MSTAAPQREAIIDLAAITANVAALRESIRTEHLMAVVKADAYGHGAVPVAQAALAGGADWLGVADVTEAIALRAGGIRAPILAWLHDADPSFAEAAAADVSLGISAPHQLEAAAAAGSTAPVSVQLKFDTGLSRNGLSPAQWQAAAERAAELQHAGRIRVDGLFSHLSGASAEEDAAQRERFLQAVQLAAVAGLTPPLIHLASTAPALSQPESRFSMVRVGIGMYGLSPWTGQHAGLALRPAMSLVSRVVNVRRVAAGAGASYDLTWRAERETTLALVPIGYADGIPRQASGSGRVLLAGAQRPVVGRVAMDQFIVDVGDAPVAIGDPVVVFGDPATGAPSADDWAVAAGTINYEIVTRIGGRVARSYVR